MDNRKNDDKNLNNGGNNFFNKNPILIFAIFAIVIVVAFRGLGGGEMDGTLGQSAAGSKSTSYSEIKEMIKNKQVAQVGISETSIKAVDNGGRTYFAKRVNDPTLVPILE